MSENTAKRSQLYKKRKRRFYGNQFIKLKSTSEHQASENQETEDVDLNTLNLDENTVEFSKNISGSFNWRPYLRKQGFTAAPVSCFKHVALSNCWDSIVSNVRVEVRSPDCKSPNCNCTTNPCRYWLATVIKVCGYWGLLRYDGFDKITPKYFNVPDKWVNLCTEPHIHPIGWCVKNGKLLIPPKSIEPKIICWRDFLMEMLPGGRTLPPDFTFRIEEHSHNSIKKGMKLEVVDKNLISVVRSAVVTDVVGGRLHIKYSECGEEEEDEGFWCHERSSLIHPVGWAQIIGHALKSSPEYARLSLKKTLYRTFEPDDATWDMFLPVYNPIGDLKFKKKMKLEAIDPLNLSAICVATVTEVLRNNYLMIGIDGMMAANGADCFCYHASSPCIFPVGFCESNGIKLTPPKGYKTEFKWSEYLKRTKSEAAPVDLFQRDIPDHGFKEGMFLEAVDLMEPRLICVAYVTKVVGRLLKIHFDGWEEDYDQWCDCESPDLFPIGWCDVLGYRLEPPRVDGSEEKKKKKTVVKKRKKKGLTKRAAGSEDSPMIIDEEAKKNDFEDSKVMSFNFDLQNFQRGKCSCGKCEEFFLPNKNISNNGWCIYCNHPPVEHELLGKPELNASPSRAESLGEKSTGQLQHETQEVDILFSETDSTFLTVVEPLAAAVQQGPTEVFPLPEFSAVVYPLLHGYALSERDHARLSAILKEELISFLNRENLISSGNSATVRWNYNRLGAALAEKYPRMLWDLPSERQKKVRKENAPVFAVFIRRLSERRKMQRLRGRRKEVLHEMQ